MREIKFRAWHKEHESMVYFNNEKLKSDQYQMMHLAALFCGNYGDVLMQYTGLKDKNGKEIYEGDVLRFLDGYDCSTEAGYDFDEFENTGQIFWDDKYARFDLTGVNMLDYETMIEEIQTFEVIGNVYENPELLVE